MKSKFTPGPWQIKKSRLLGTIEIRNESGQSQITMLSNSLGDEETEANARLIAAAPDLFDALKDIRDYFKFMIDDPKFPAYQKAQQALHKALNG